MIIKLIQILISIAIIYFLFNLIDIDLFIEVLTQSSPYFLLAVFLVCVFDRILMAVKWNMLLNGTVDKTIAYLEAIKLYFTSSFYGFFLPLGGVGPDVVRAISLVRKYDIEKESVLLSIVVERVLGVAASVLALVVGLTIFVYSLDTHEGIGYFYALLITSTLAAIFIILMFFNEKLGSKLLIAFQVVERKKLTKLAKYFEALARYKNKKVLLRKVTFYSFIEQSMPVLAFYFSSLAIDKQVSFIHCLAVVPVVSIIERLPISYAGIGVREASYAGLLTLFGYHYSDAIFISLVDFFVYVTSLAIGGFITIIDHDKYPARPA